MKRDEYLTIGAVALGVGAVVALFTHAANAGSVPTMSTAHDLTTLAPEYARLFATATIRPERLASVDREINTLASNKARYMAVARATGVPWHVIAILHALEGGGTAGDFSKHLHNGDPLTSRTTHVPANHPAAPPAAGEGQPYSWEESATDALMGRHWGSDWSIPATLWRLESYNGWGYRPRGVPSPYLWSGTDVYTKGKYVADNVFDANAVSQQIGAVALLKRMSERGVI